MEKDSDKELMGGAPITSNRFLEKPTDEIKNGDFKSYKKPRNTKKESAPWTEKRIRWKQFLKRIHCLLACCNSQIIVENSQLDGKPPENYQGRATEEDILWHQKPAAYVGKSKLLKSKEK